MVNIHSFYEILSVQDEFRLHGIVFSRALKRVFARCIFRGLSGPPMTFTILRRFSDHSQINISSSTDPNSSFFFLFGPNELQLPIYKRITAFGQFLQEICGIL